MSESNANQNINTPPASYLCLATNTAPKLGRHGGRLTYKILTDPDRQQLYLTITHNEGGGYFSREIVAFDAVERCLPADTALAFGAKLFARSFKGRSANQPGFAAALLRSIGLLGIVDLKPHLHVVTGDWRAWKTTMLAQTGEPYVPAAGTAVTATEATDAALKTAFFSLNKEAIINEAEDAAEEAEGNARVKDRKSRHGKQAKEERHAYPA